MARALDRFGLSTALHKHYGLDEYIGFFNALERKSARFYSMGITRADEDKFGKLVQGAPGAVQSVCIDVANGYHENFVTFVTRLRSRHRNW